MQYIQVIRCSPASGQLGRPIGQLACLLPSIYACHPAVLFCCRSGLPNRDIAKLSPLDYSASKRVASRTPCNEQSNEQQYDTLDIDTQGSELSRPIPVCPLYKLSLTSSTEQRVVFCRCASKAVKTFKFRLMKPRLRGQMAPLPTVTNFDVAKGRVTAARALQISLTEHWKLRLLRSKLISVQFLWLAIEKLQERP